MNNDWEPIEEYWMIVLNNRMSFDVEEGVARTAWGHKHNIGTDSFTITDIYGSQYVFKPKDICFITSNSPEIRKRIQMQERMYDQERSTNLPSWE